MKNALYSFKVWSLTAMLGSLCLPVIYLFQTISLTSEAFGDIIMVYLLAVIGSMIIFIIAAILFSIISFYVSKLPFAEEQRLLVMTCVGSFLLLSYFIVLVILFPDDKDLTDAEVLAVVGSYLAANMVSVRILKYPSDNQFYKTT